MCDKWRYPIRQKSQTAVLLVVFGKSYGSKYNLILHLEGGLVEQEEEASKISQLNENVEFDAKNEWKKSSNMLETGFFFSF